MNDAFVQELLQRGVATAAQIAEARDAVRTRGGSLTYRLRRAGCDPWKVLEVLAFTTGLDIVHANRILAAADQPLDSLPDDTDGALWWRLLAVPLGRRDGLLDVAFADPAVATAGKLLGLPPHRAYLGLDTKIRQTLEALFGPEPDHSTVVSNERFTDIDSDIHDEADDESTLLLMEQMEVAASGADNTADVELAAMFSDLAPVGQDNDLVRREQEAGFVARTADPAGDGPPLRRVGPYEVGERLTYGSMSEIFSARHTGNGNRVVVKFLAAHLRTDIRARERMRREIRATLDIAHPSVVCSRHGGEQDGVLFQVTDYFDGGDLKMFLEEHGPLPVPMAVTFVRQLLDGLLEAHTRGWVHRDLKPENVFLSSAGRVALADFGVIHAEGDELLTMPGEVVGTPAYMSPEQVSGQDVDARSDLFSLGVMLYEMLTGEQPFSSREAAISMFRVVEGRINEPMLLQPTVPPALDSVVVKLLQKDPAKRFASVTEVHQALSPMYNFVDRHHPGLVEHTMWNPEMVMARLRADQSRADMYRARAKMRASPPARMQAAFSLWRAARLRPDDDKLRALLDEMCEQDGLHWSADEDRLPALDPNFRGDPAVMARAVAALALDAGDLHRASVFLRRHLLFVPDDDVARLQLSAILGDDEWAPFPVERPSSS